MFPKLIIVVFMTGLLIAFDQKSFALPFFVCGTGCRGGDRVDPPGAAGRWPGWSSAWANIIPCSNQG